MCIVPEECGVYVIVIKFYIMLLGQCQPCLANLKYTNSVSLPNTMHFLEMAFVGWETETIIGKGVGRSTQIKLFTTG